MSNVPKHFGPPDPDWRPSTPPVTSATFDQLILEHEVVAIHFWAVWNRYDRTMDETIQQLQKEIGEKFYFVSCNIDLEENWPLCKRFEVLNVPHLGIVLSCKLRKPVLGYRNVSRLREELLVNMLVEFPQKPWWKIW